MREVGDSSEEAIDSLCECWGIDNEWAKLSLHIEKPSELHDKSHVAAALQALGIAALFLVIPSNSL